MNISFGYTSVVPSPATPKKKVSLLPLLTVLFLFSYGLMTMLIVEQGSTIQSQRNLIKVLLRDSTELWAGKGKALSDQQVAQARAHAPSTETQSSQAPSSQNQSNQNQSNQIQSNNAQSNRTPSTRAVPQQHSRTGKAVKPESEVPPVPASDLIDRRRALSAI